MKVRSDGRVYAVNLEPQSYFDGDLYQGYIIAPPGRWTEVTFPFDGLALTSKVLQQHAQSKVLYSCCSVVCLSGVAHSTHVSLLLLLRAQSTGLSITAALLYKLVL